MSRGVLVRSGELGGSKLSRAIQNGRIGRSWYVKRPQSAAEWREHALQLRQSFSNRDWLEPLSAAFGLNAAASTPARERLLRAAESGIVVTTGQQPGLFGGPIYTWSKALSALATANALEEQLSIPVAPVFWAATDDTDWLEASETWFAGPSGLVRASLISAPVEALSMRDVALSELEKPMELLMRACGSGANASVLDIVKASYNSSETIGRAFVRLLRSLLEPLGISVLDAAHPDTRSAADEFLRAALLNSQQVQQQLEVRTQEIRDAGYSPQVEIISDLSLVFQSNSDGTRQRVPLRQAREVAQSAPKGSLGSNVLLRPVLERYLLPTACYHAGPGELAYFAQVAPVAQALGVAVPVVAPRWAAEIVEESVLTLRNGLHISDEQLRDGYAAAGVIAREHLDESVADAIERLRVMLDSQVTVLRRALHDAPGSAVWLKTVGDQQTSGSSLLPDSVVDGLGKDLVHRLDRFERRVLAAVKHRETDAIRQLESLRAAIVPNGKPAERVLNIIPLLVRYGTDVLEQMRDVAAEHAHSLVSGTQANSTRD